MFNISGLLYDPPRTARWPDAVRLTFTATVFLAATLLFIVEPMFAKMALPPLGGSSEVWTACVLFYQFALLAGYIYADALRRLPRIRDQAIVHGALCLLAALVLPLTIHQVLQPPDAAHALPWLLTALTLSVGAPFFVLSATSPLLQSWFAGIRTGANPYALYAASNAGSLLALVCYPFLIEPIWGLALQSHVWSLGYFCFVALLVVCGIAARNRAGGAGAIATSPRISWRRRFRWIMLAFVPSSLMLSVTLYLSEQVAPIPLLWTLPLAIYLASFVVVFARSWRAPVFPERAAALLLPPLIVTLALDLPLLPILAIPVHLLIFGIVAIVCHGALAADRPEADRLTEFYCCLAIGGLLGGIFNGVVAPLLFSDIYEYPLVLLLSTLALRPRVAAATRRERLLDLLFPVALAVGLFAVSILLRSSTILSGPLALVIAFSLGAILCFSFSGRPIRFALGLASIFAIGALSVSHANVGIERNFYGVKRIFSVGSTAHVLTHGHTVHGSEYIGGPLERIPTTYYAQSGPVGDIIAALVGDRRPVAVVGLGVGSVACYRRPHQRWTFYELDPGMVAIAENPRYFRYLTNCAPGDPIVVGDGRLELAKAKAHNYGLIIMDAYSSDAIPTHLLTREAVRLYEGRLASGGIIAFHVSNKYFAFAPLIAALAKDAGLIARMRTDVGAGSVQRDYAKMPSQWVVVVRHREDLRALGRDTRWISVPPAQRVWTDDYSSLVTVLAHPL